MLKSNRFLHRSIIQDTELRRSIELKNARRLIEKYILDPIY